jgi:hypothetical protein
MVRPDRAYGGLVFFGQLDDGDDVGERAGSIDAKRLGPLIPRVVVPTPPLLEWLLGHSPRHNR